jgi:hypothetical protein
MLAASQGVSANADSRQVAAGYRDRPIHDGVATRRWSRHCSTRPDPGAPVSRDDRAMGIKPPPLLTLIHGTCSASAEITVHGRPVGFMYREEPVGPGDSGWRFFAGTETPEYADEPGNFALHEVEAIARRDRDIIPLLDAPEGAAFERDATGALVPIVFALPESN